MNIQCPKCAASVTATPDSWGFVTCAACGVRLRLGATGGAPPATDLHALLDELRSLRRMQGEIMQTQAQILNLLTGRAAARPTPAPAPAPPPLAAGPRAPAATPSPTRAPVASMAPASSPAAPPTQVPRVRQRRKTVLVVDDDPDAALAAVTALEQAQVPVRLAADGHQAVAAIAAHKPDTIVLELALGDPMPGRDLVNMIKATMEWVDIPIVLYTRLPVADINEARTQHGADELVLKGPGSPEALVNRVIHVFQQHA
jgi:CheY-like chemotaxis protein